MSPPPATLRSTPWLTAGSVRWVLRHRAYTRWHLIRYARFAWFKLRNRHVITTGFVFLDRGVRVQVRPGHGRLVLGRWVHLGAGTVIRCHEGTLTIGDKCVLARDVSVFGYLDIEIGDSTLIADGAYICDFDHRFDRPGVPIKDQGIACSRVRIGRDVWLGTRVTVTRGSVIGDGTVVGAHAVVTGRLPADSIAVGVPARVISSRPSGRAH